MKYTEFISAIEMELNKIVKEGVSVSINKILKNNTTWRYGVLIQQKGVQAAPTIYLEEYFLTYRNGNSLENIAKEILRFYEAMKWEPSMDLNQILEFEYIRQKIVPKMISKKHNRRFLMEVPYVEWMDLAIVFYLLLDATEIGTTTMMIQNSHLQEWNLKKEDLYRIAMENAALLLPAELLPVSVVATELMSQQTFHECNLFGSEEYEEQECMYVLTNEMRSMGAVCIAYPYIGEMIADLLRENYYILPSSIHEMIIIPESKSIGMQAFQEMITEINMTEVDREEILAGHAYYFDREKGVFVE